MKQLFLMALMAILMQAESIQTDGRPMIQGDVTLTLQVGGRTYAVTEAGIGGVYEIDGQVQTADPATTAFVVTVAYGLGPNPKVFTQTVQRDSRGQSSTFTLWLDPTLIQSVIVDERKTTAIFAGSAPAASLSR